MYQLFAFLICTMFFGAQTPADTSLFAVVYVDVMPASKAAAVTAFKQYRDASRKEEGFVRFDFFEQVGRPGRLAIIETWSNQKAFDAHAAAAHTKQWRGALERQRCSFYLSSD
jgi:quinol monooxygenase YgiN